MPPSRNETKRSPRRPAASFAARALRFYASLESPNVPAGIEVMNPYADPRVHASLSAFLTRYFADNEQRLLVIGINPGRFGAGITGITFTDPVALADDCGIETDLPRRRELSSIFIYDVIRRFGGAEAFYRRCFLSAVSPLGFTRGGKNLNYYDTPALRQAATPFIVRTMTQQVALGVRRDHAVVLGRGQNMQFFARLNAEHGWFGELHALDHPRPIMQYRRKQLDAYLDRYEQLLRRLSRPRAE